MTTPIANYLMPGNIRFGFGAVNLTGQEAAQLGATHAFIITDPGVEAAGLTAPVIDEQVSPASQRVPIARHAAPATVPSARQVPIVLLPALRTQAEPVAQRVGPTSSHAPPTATSRRQRPLAGVMVFEHTAPASHAAPVARHGPPTAPGAKQVPW